MTERPFRYLFCDRKETLGLPANMLKVWLCHYMHESKSRESWPSIETVMRLTRLSRRAVCRARADLKKHGWLEQVRSFISTRGNHVPVYRVTRGEIPSASGDTRVSASGDTRVSASGCAQVGGARASGDTGLVPGEARVGASGDTRGVPGEAPEVDSLEVDSQRQVDTHTTKSVGVVGVASSKDQSQERFPSDAALADRAKRRAIQKR